MSRILLADDSPHARQMGERILREEGFEVVSLTDGHAVLARLAEVDPDLILADAFLPGKSGFELCRYVKNDPSLRHARVVLTAGLLETLDEEEARGAGCDAILKKPFEASKLVATIKPLVEAAHAARGFVEASVSASSEPPSDAAVYAPPAPAPAIDAERVRAAVTLALDAAMPSMIQEITERVLIALGH
jgi:CheY-like chemotaxis protein